MFESRFPTNIFCFGRMQFSTVGMPHFPPLAGDNKEGRRRQRWRINLFLRGTGSRDLGVNLLAKWKCNLITLLPSRRFMHSPGRIRRFYTLHKHSSGFPRRHTRRHHLLRARPRWHLVQRTPQSSSNRSADRLMTSTSNFIRFLR